MSSLLLPRTDYSKTPAGTPPPGVTPNFDDPPSLTPTLIGMCALLIAWGTTFAVIRVWNNRKRLNIGDGEQIGFKPVTDATSSKVLTLR